MNFTWLFIIVQLIFLEGLLSIDNAAVLGAMVAALPVDQPIPWPSWLKGLGHRLNPMLGGQRSAALKVGLLGAYLGRGAMLVVAHQIIRYPWLQFVGGAYLVYLGIEHLAAPNEAMDEDRSFNSTQLVPGFWQVVLMVELADLAFSLDNVVAAVALADHIVVVMVGVALGILALRWAASFFSVMVEREPILQHAAYLLVLVIGLRFCLEHLLGWEISPVTQFAGSLSILGLALLYAHWTPLQPLRPIVHRGRHTIHQGLVLIKQIATFRPFWGTETGSSKERG
jgi:tellurite resistance protein TerC